MPEALITLGQRYLAEGRVEQLREAEKFLWKARVRMDLSFETEALLRGQRVRAYSCDCTAGLRKMPCPHLIAMLLMLRRHREQQKMKRQVRQLSLPPLLPAVLLEEASPGELLAFTREWIQQDPNFALAIKARFFYQQGPSYHQANLERIFAPLLDEQGHLFVDGQEDNRQIQLLYDQVLRQTARLMTASKDLEAAFNMRYLLDKLDQSGPFRQRPALLRKILSLLLDPPDLSEALQPEGTRFDLLLLALEILHRMKETEATHAVLLALQAYSGFPEARYRMHQAVKGLLLRKELGTRDLEALLLVYYQSLPDRDQPASWLEELQLPRLSPATYLRLGETLLETGDFQGADTLCEESISLYPQNLDLLRHKRDILWEMHRVDELVHLYRHLIQQSLDPSDVSDALLHVPATLRDTFLQALEEDMGTLPKTFDRNGLLASVLAARGKWFELATHLAEAQSQKLLLRHIPEMAVHHPEALQQAVLSFLTAYLDHHIGPKATACVADILRQLETADQRTTRNALLDMLRTRFPERRHLLDWIAHRRTAVLHEN